MNEHPIRAAFLASVPIILGYVALGIPCGVLGQQAGMTVWMVFLLSALLYSGTGQYMIPGMYMTGSGPVGIAAAVALVCSRQLLYASALIPYLRTTRMFSAITYAAGVTDESFAVNIQRFEQGADPTQASGTWTVNQARWVNIFSQTSWALSNVVGVLLSELVAIPTSVAAFAMTSIFLCLLFTQKGGRDIVIAGIAAFAGVIVIKALGLTNLAIFGGAVIGVIAGMLASRSSKKRGEAGSGEVAME